MKTNDILKSDCCDRVAAALLPPRLFASIAYYTLMYKYPIVSIDTEAKYIKNNKTTHRFSIADTRGPLNLTIPVSKPSGATKWREVEISNHGRWYETIPIALESAYGRTPFFEFYIDRILPLFDLKKESIIELCIKADQIVRNILNFNVDIKEKSSDIIYNDFTNIDIDSIFIIKPYWQVRKQQLGFIPNLSILDLIFNLGPEAELYIENLSTLIVENNSINNS